MEPTARRTAVDDGDGAPPADSPWASRADELLNAVARRGCLLLPPPRVPVGRHVPLPGAVVETVRHGSSGDAKPSADVLRSHGKPSRFLGRATSKLKRRHMEVGLECGSRIALEVNAVAVAAVVLAVMLGTKQCDPSGDSNSSNSESERNGESLPISISVLCAHPHEQRCKTARPEIDQGGSVPAKVVT